MIMKSSRASEMSEEMEQFKGPNFLKELLITR